MITSKQDNKTIEQIPWKITISNSINTHAININDVVNCYFIEDIYSLVMTGKLTVVDTVGFDEFLPLVGGERISIDYSSQMGDNDQEQKTLEFVVIKINRVSQDQSLRKTIDILFVQPYHFDFHMNNFSLSLRNKKHTDIIKTILDNHIGVDSYISEDCNESIDYFTTNLRTPADNIKWLMNRSSSSVTKQPGYLLFYNTKDGFNLITMESLLSSTKMMDGDKLRYTISVENQYFINKILSLNVSKIDYNSLNTLLKGKYLGYNIKEKEIIQREYSFSDAIDRFTILGKYTLFDENKIRFSSIIETNTGETDKNVIDNLYYGNWIKQYCVQQTVDIVVAGHNRRYAGGMIEIEWQSGDSTSMIDKNMMGKYLVKSITHQYTPKGIIQYKQKMVLIKNGFNDSDYSNLTKAVKVNI